MDDILKENFITTMVEYGELSETVALGLWEQHQDDFIEDCWTEIDSLMANILNTYKETL